MRSWGFRLWRLCPTRYACATGGCLGSTLWSGNCEKGAAKAALFSGENGEKRGLSVAQGEDFGFVGFQSEREGAVDYGIYRVGAVLGGKQREISVEIY
jgi:hypothetical protein